MTHSHTLSARNLTVSYGDLPILQGLEYAVEPGKISAIIGANGCGKSTLLRALARVVSPAGGSVLLDGEALHTRPAKAVARVIGLLPQSPLVPEGVSVRDLVRRGRHPHLSLMRRWSAADATAVGEALALTGMHEFADRPVDELSGGQRQRAWIAMALAQDPRILLLDEPTTYLDIAHQIEVLDLLTDINRARGTTVVMVLHDLNLAARYAERLVAVVEGRIHSVGEPRTVVTREYVREVIGLQSEIIPDPVSGAPIVVPLGRHHV
ncbi:MULTISPECIES: ABC transporter ATP-binding protein [unclassified Leucobacter]|uniref:ABC transporter ATP-binding protein n=1 Tax=unclassified Leucobacter TaxID=2621730 RepID=UPI00165D4101|nr:MULTISPECIES: ABC transporter ATP-binding protein [unclassified Leucobacter]MBC9928274.1 ABC transporter ATP-binding protein [Leucobacter sp. cx-169]